MKSNKLKTAAFCTIAALAGISFGALDQIQHDRLAAAQLYDTCKTQPAMAACGDREVAVRSVRYTFNGLEASDRNPVTAFGANE